MDLIGFKVIIRNIFNVLSDYSVKCIGHSFKILRYIIFKYFYKILVYFNIIVYKGMHYKDILYNNEYLIREK
jgi:hypothetical protein